VAESREFRPETYLAAAKEHMVAAVELDVAKRYALAHYVAGVAAECVLRAYKSRLDPVLDERHDLHLLAKNGRCFDGISGRRQEEVAGALGELVVRWENRHRYRSEAALRKFLTGRRLFPKRGDVLECSSRKVVSAMIEIVTAGVQRWKN
jgi:hypothetical protein